MKQLYFVLLLLMFSFSLFSCASKTPEVSRLPEGAVLAVAGFSQPVHAWQMLAGVLPEETKTIQPEVLELLNNTLDTTMRKRLNTSFMGPMLVKECQEVVLSKVTRSRTSAFTYWLDVAKCMPADYLLVPFVFEWDERQGGQWGVNEPAKVTIDLNLIDLENESMRRFHFDEKQISLGENVLDMGKFIKRGGKWVKASQLATDGINKGLGELGL